ncbi:MAG: AAA-like domain-containing protein [Fimbriimonadaceae bacterium]|nr:AAA-like domain-containing protein [Fimbriimonadaceae bacterium]
MQERTWQIRLLGGFEASRGGTTIPRLRSKTSRALLAYLALAPGKEFDRSDLAAMFWPDSDGDRQQQSFRRSLSDIRQVLEPELERGQILVGRRENIALESSAIQTDIQTFREAVRRSKHSDDRVTALARVIESYGGSLLPGHAELCFANPRMELEEAFASATQELIRLLLATDPREAIRVGRAAAVLAPFREDIQVATMEAYLAAGLPAEALRQFEEWERVLADTFGEQPSESAYRVLNAIPRQVRPPINDTTPDVVIVDSGRSGAALAAELGRRGEEAAVVIQTSSGATIDRYLRSGKVVVAITAEPSEPREWLDAVLELSHARGIPTMEVGPEVSIAAIVERVERLRAAPKQDRAEIELSAGAVPLESRFYVERQADGELNTALKRREGVILLQGPRQIGKTSLLARALDWARGHGHVAALCDFQSLSASQLVDEDHLYRSIAHRLARDVRAPEDWREGWSAWLGPNDNLDEAVERILASTPSRVYWAFDEADRLFGQPYSDDLFGLIRGWHNRRALEPDGPWSRLTIILTYATEVHLFIRDLNQSPFNVGVRIDPRDFDLNHIEELNRKYGSPLRVKEDLEQFYEIIGGQPYLVRRGFDWLATTRRTLSDLEHSISVETGPFADHLRRIATVTRSSADIWTALVEYLQRGTTPSELILSRLVAGGVFTRSPQLRFRSPLYRSAIGALLSPSSQSNG